MTFTSLSFFLFLPFVYAAFYFTRDHFRWLVLLISSYVFYATFRAPQLILALALVTAVSYVCGIRLGRTANGGKRELTLWFGVSVCAFILVASKLAPRFAMALGAETKSPYANLLVSIGISFFALQAVSYIADVYLGIHEPERHFGYHALALAFFPKLLQGPIERAGDLLPQLKAPYVFGYNAMRSGMLLFSWGLFKKVVVADRLAVYVNVVYDNVQDHTGASMVLATYFYAIQIYADFSGYTDMARGSARMFNIRLSKNFASPYSASSVADFWRRWHISFSRWILDYIFRPLQMRWRSLRNAGTALALLLTFVFSGVWHRATWCFLIWGLLHGTYLAASVYLRPIEKRIRSVLGLERIWLGRAVGLVLTFHLVVFAWVFFRANSVQDASWVVRNIPSGLGQLISICVGVVHIGQGMGIIQPILRSTVQVNGSFVFGLTLISTLSLVVVPTAWKSCNLYKFPWCLRWTVYSLLMLAILLSSLLWATRDNPQFIYGRF